MGKKILSFGKNEIEKNKLYRQKTPIFFRRRRYGTSMSI